MQPSSILGPQGGPVQGVSGVTACLQELHSQPQSNISSQLDQTNQNQPHHHQHVMDDFLEQILNMPTWSDVGGGGKAPWEYNGITSNGGINMDTAQNNQKLFTMSLMPPGIGPMGSQGLSSTAREQASLQHGENLQFSFDDSFLASRLQQQQNENLIGPAQDTPGSMVLQLSTGNASASQLLAAIGTSSRSPTVLARSPSSAGSSGSEGSATHQPSADNIQSPTRVSHTWHASYVGGMLSLPLSLGQGKADLLHGMDTSGNEARLLGKRSRAEDDTRPANTGRDAHLGGLFPTFGGGHAVRPNHQHSHIPQSGQGVPFQTYGAHTAIAQPQQPPGGVGGTPAPAPARPRVRARRGQATDPHSIAERLRRERIAERMKALQELVPSSNKTDKASMLDEIVDYVKFLQLQVKVLSMSRLGGAGTVAPLVGDIPASEASTLSRSNGTQSSNSQDDLTLTERQVAKLMEKDMGSALQYLQGKGLCLMPLSLASAISGTTSRSQTTNHNAPASSTSNHINSPPRETADSNNNSIEENATTSSIDNTNCFKSTVKVEDPQRRGQ
eukprot:Gb_22201 [translate_table: standard]